MGIWYSIQGTVRCRKCEEVGAIVEKLDDFSTEILVGTEDLEGDIVVIEIDGGIQCSYSSAEKFDNLVLSLSPYAVEVGQFVAHSDDDKATLWVGSSEEAIRVAKEAKTVAKIKKLLGNLSVEGKKQLLEEMGEGDIIDRRIALIDRLRAEGKTEMEVALAVNLFDSLPSNATRGS